MSATVTTEEAVESCQIAEATPVEIPAEALDSTHPAYLRDLKYEFGEKGLVPAALTLDACFDADCSFATQDEAERIREHVRAAAFLGAGRVVVRVEEVADEEKVRPALAACVERARREGVALAVEGATVVEGEESFAPEIRGASGP